MLHRQGLGKKTVFVAFLALLTCAGLGYFAMRKQEQEQEQEQELSPGRFRATPVFELKDRSGRSHSPDEWKGKVILVHFWAKWCPPCLPELPQFLKVAGAYEGRPLVLVPVSLDASWDEASQVLPAELPAQVIPLLDTAGKVPDLFGTYQYPETYLISKDQRILAKWVGPQDWSSAAIREFIESALNR